MLILRKFSCPAVGNVFWYNAFGKSFGSRYQEIYKFMAFNSLIPFLGTSPKETSLIIEKALCTKVSISALLTNTGMSSTSLGNKNETLLIFNKQILKDNLGELSVHIVCLWDEIMNPEKYYRQF